MNTCAYHEPTGFDKDCPACFDKNYKNNIVITVSGGCVTDVDGLPEGYTYTLNDLDC